MLGAIIGDIVGSRYEFDPIKTSDFELLHENCVWTDDSVMTLAVADALIEGHDMAQTLRRWGLEYPASYGHHFWDWLNDPEMAAYGSYGNGASMRVSAAAWLAKDFAECLSMARRSAEVSHNHPEGVRGAQATAAAIYAARTGMGANDIRDLVGRLFGYELTASTADFRPGNVFEIKSWKSVPQAMICALEATSFEQALRLAVSLGGDADTQAAIAGSIAEPLFGIPESMAADAVARLTGPMAGMLAKARAAAAAMTPRPVSQADVAAVPRWDPEENVRWEAKLRAKFGGYEDPPGYREEMDKIAGLFGADAEVYAQEAAETGRRGWLKRFLGRR